MNQDISNNVRAGRSIDAASDTGVRLDDVELLGRYRGSGLQEPPYLLRRRDGQVVQVSRLLYLIASRLDATRHPDPAERCPEAVAARVSTRFGQEVSPENVVYLIDRKLAPAGLVVRGAAPGADGPADPGDRANPLLSLRMRLPVVPERLHRRLSTWCQPLFRPRVVVAVLVALATVDAWLALGQRDNLAAGAHQLVYQPQLLLGITVLTVACGAFHEIGHAAAARYGGATPGAMGAGVYLVWPVFYTDVTDAYRLDRRGRLRTDLGGVYFNVLFTLAATGVHLATGYRPLLVFLVVAQIETLRQFLPFVRLDGYYVVSDLAGVPNLFTYMRPVLVSLLRRGDEGARHAARTKLEELTPRARRIIVAWVCLTVPVLLANVVVFLLLAPRFAGAAWGSAGGQLQAMTTGGRVDVVGVVNGMIGLVLLVLPLAGMSYVATRLAGRLVARAPAWWRARPLATVTAAVSAATVVALQVAVQWPDTFASALEQAQVAQAIEEADAEGADQVAGLSVTPPAEPARVPASNDTSVPAPTSPTTEPFTRDGSGDRDRGSDSSEASWAGSAMDAATSADGASAPGNPDAAGTPTTGTVAPSASASTSTSTSTSSPGTRPNSRDVPVGDDTASTTSTTATTQPPPPPGLVRRLIDMLF